MGGDVMAEALLPSPPPQSSPTRGEEAIVDDRRRFRELWKELVFARTLVPLVVAAAFVIAARELLPRPAFLFPPVQVMGWMLYMVIPSAAAKRGLPVPGLVGGLVLVPLVVFTTFDISFCHPWSPPVVATFTCAVGVSEGMLERSLATTLAGLAGGMLIAPFCGMVARPVQASDVLEFAAVLISAHLGIALSLALGRLIRDWPKRKQDAGEPTQ